jgi:hypothetical protein
LGKGRLGKSRLGNRRSTDLIESCY